MRQKYIIVIAGLVLVLCGLFVVYKNENFRKEEGLVFSNKQKCNSYKDSLSKKFLSPENTFTGTIRELEEVWFSKKLNSCLYSVEETTHINNRIIQTLIIYDYFSSKELDRYEFDASNASSTLNNLKKFEDKLKELE